MDVSLTMTGFLNDQNLTVLAVVCGELSSKNPIMDLWSVILPKFFLVSPQHLVVFSYHGDMVLHDAYPIEFIWKSIKRIISEAKINSEKGMKKVIRKGFKELSSKGSFARSWRKKFILNV